LSETEIEQQQEQKQMSLQQHDHQQQERIFQVTNGLRSKYTKRAYRLAFSLFDVISNISEVLALMKNMKASSILFRDILAWPNWLR
jgi:hypothetical protein